MTTGVHPLPTTTPLPEDRAGTVQVSDGRLVIEHLVVDDPEAVRLVATAAPPERAGLMRRIVSVGARGLTTMGIGVDLADIDSRVHAIVRTASEDAERSITEIIERSRSSLGEQFDPELRTSMLARALDEFTAWREGFLRTLDPTVEDSAATALIGRLRDMVGPDGALEQRLHEALDLDSDASALSKLSATIHAGFEDLRRDLARSQAAAEARADEAEKGTAHGIAFEDVVEGHLRRWASNVRGTVVERTTTTSGDLASTSRVGDFVVELPSGHRIVIEAKRHAVITLTGPDGILAELDRAMANRQAHSAICIAGRDAYPEEVGAFNVYGDRVLVVDEGDGAMIAVGLQWAVAALVRRAGGATQLDGAAVADRVDRIRKAAESLSGARRAVTNIRGSLDKLHDTLGSLRSDMLDQIGDLDRLLAASESLGTTDSRS